MSAPTIDANGIPRNGRGQPLILPPGGEGKPLAYLRASTVAKALDDTTALTNWKMRRLLAGIIADPTLLDEADRLLADEEANKSALNDLCEAGLRAGGSQVKAEFGSALHDWCVVADEMGDLSRVPEQFRRDISAYIEAMRGLTILSTEQFVVVDDIKTAGTYDRLVELADGRVMLADIKTGKWDNKYPHSVCHQLAIYSRGVRYSPDDGHRWPIDPRLSLDEALLIHMPQGEGRCDLYTLDIGEGWHWVKVAASIRDEWLKAKPIKGWSA